MEKPRKITSKIILSVCYLLDFFHPSNYYVAKNHKTWILRLLPNMNNYKSQNILTQTLFKLHYCFVLSIAFSVLKPQRLQTLGLRNLQALFFHQTIDPLLKIHLWCAMDKHNIPNPGKKPPFYGKSIYAAFFGETATEILRGHKCCSKVNICEIVCMALFLLLHQLTN